MPNRQPNRDPAFSRRSFLARSGAGLLAAGALGGALSRAAPDAAGGPRVGFALVGIGRLTMGQLLPAFARCRIARPAALVSGSPGKA